MTTPPAGDAEPISRPRLFAIMAVLLLVEVLSSLEQTMVMTALPTVVREFGSITSAGWLVTAFLLAQAATAAVGGRLGDIFGRRLLLFIIIGLCAVGSLVSALGDNVGTIIFGRVIQGASGAILPLCYGITRQVVPAGKAPFWIGVLTGGYSFAAAIGYILGGYLADIGSWRSIFYMTTLYSVALLPLLALVVPALRGARTSGRFDFLGAVLFAPAVAAILYGITSASKSGWMSLQAGGFAAGGLVVAGLWFWHEWRRKDPLIDVRLLRRREIWLGNLCGALASLGMMQLPVVTLMLMQQPVMAGIGLGVTGAMAGLLKLPSNVSSLAASPLSGWLAGRNGARLAMLVGATVAVLAWTYLFFFHATLPQVVGGTIACAFGSSMLLASIPNMVLEGAPLERSSEVTGLTSVIRAMFAAIGAQTIAILLATSHIIEPATGARFPSEAAYQLVFGWVAVLSGLIVALCLAVRIGPVASARRDRPADGVAGYQTSGR